MHTSLEIDPDPGADGVYYSNHKQYTRSNGFEKESTMMVYLVQHGDAVDKTYDPDRPLTDAGRHAVERVAAFVAKAGVTIPAIWHSDKTRARETAEILAVHVAPGISPAERKGLKPNDDVTAIAKELQEQESDVALVGHMPHLSRLAGLLTTGKADADVIAFERGGVVAIQRDAAGKWRIAWVLPPSLLVR